MLRDHWNMSEEIAMDGTYTLEQWLLWNTHSWAQVHVALELEGIRI
jgi:hypothetical protein